MGKLSQLEANCEAYKQKAEKHKKANDFIRAHALYTEAFKVQVEIAKITHGDQQIKNIEKAQQLKIVIDKLAILAPPVAENLQTNGNGEVFQEVLEKGDSEEFEIIYNTGVSFKDIVGAADIKEFVRENWVDRFNPKFKKIYDRKGASELCKGLALYGIAGCGKTYMARAIATEVGATFFNVDGKMTDKYVGETEKAVARLFRRAEKEKLSIIFIDEMNDVFGMGNGANESHRIAAVNQWLREMDGIKGSAQNVIVIGGTNFPNDIYPSVMSRLTQKFRVDLPKQALRKDLLKMRLTGFIDDEKIYEEMAKKTAGFSSRNIRDLSEVAKKALEKLQIRGMKMGLPDYQIFNARLNMEDVATVLNNFSSSVSKESMSHIDAFEKNYSITSEEGNVYEYIKKIMNGA